MIRNRFEELDIVPSPVVEQEQKISTKLDKTLKELVSLKSVINKIATPDTTAWTFDIKRNAQGNISGVTANGNVSDTPPWEFNVKRTTQGQISRVIATTEGPDITPWIFNVTRDAQNNIKEVVTQR